MNVQIRPMTAADWPSVATIYAEGIATGHATFAETPPDSFADFAKGKRMDCAIVAVSERGTVVAWATCMEVSDRCVFAGVAEVSVYVSASARGRGVGHAILQGIIASSEAVGLWTLQAGIFPENAASLALHRRHGFREVGVRERLGRMTHGPLAGRWRDVVLLERRSGVVGQA